MPLKTSCARGHIWQPAPGIDRCPRCSSVREAERNRSDPHRAVVRSYRWQKARKLVKARDGNRCAFEGPDCYGQLEVHHLVSVRRGGAPYDPANLVTVCRHHHEVIERGQRQPLPS